MAIKCIKYRTNGLAFCSTWQCIKCRMNGLFKPVLPPPFSVNYVIWLALCVCEREKERERDVGCICWCTVHGWACYSCCTVLSFLFFFFPVQRFALNKYFIIIIINIIIHYLQKRNSAESSVARYARTTWALCNLNTQWCSHCLWRCVTATGAEQQCSVWLYSRLRAFLENTRPFTPRLRFFFFFKVEIRSRTLIPLFMPGSVYSGSASWVD